MNGDDLTWKHHLAAFFLLAIFLLASWNESGSGYYQAFPPTPEPTCDCSGEL
ncbi:MAG: hypothetical protein JSW37_09890 [Anaerolineales bacterium]|nr:MAG: hypothetical protein JSW37_09890 [Anaerolineales bacterium]